MDTTKSSHRNAQVTQSTHTRDSRGVKVDTPRQFDNTRAKCEKKLGRPGKSGQLLVKNAGVCPGTTRKEKKFQSREPKIRSSEITHKPHSGNLSTV